MKWNKKQIKDHIRTAKLLAEIKNEVFKILKNEKNISEYKIQQFVLKKFKEQKIKTVYTPIVAFGSNTGLVHYYPSKKSKKLEPNTLVMLDIWGKLKGKNNPFADITLMAFKGSRVPKKVQEVLQIVFEARNKSVRFIKNNLKKGKIPIGAQIDKVARNHITNKGYGKYFLHNTGHSLGLRHVHGDEGLLGRDNNKPIQKNVAYTIEPGIYLKNKFGIRSEIDFYIDAKSKMIITSEIQKRIELL